MWERGLKPLFLGLHNTYTWSLPMWERVLKPLFFGLRVTAKMVAPHVGAWIETGLVNMR